VQRYATGAHDMRLGKDSDEGDEDMADDDDDDDDGFLSSSEEEEA
jgi:hypothetical protein